MSVNRKRKIRVEMRLTEDENDIFMQRMSDIGIQNRDAYLRKMALTGYILRLDLSEVRETLRLLSNATNNINQIAMRANETRSIYANDMIQLREEVGILRSQVSDAMKVFSKVRKYLEL
jgi:hypothetical protein